MDEPSCACVCVEVVERAQVLKRCAERWNAIQLTSMRVRLGLQRGSRAQLVQKKGGDEGSRASLTAGQKLQDEILTAGLFAPFTPIASWPVSERFPPCGSGITISTSSSFVVIVCHYQSGEAPSNQCLRGKNPSQ